MQSSAARNNPYFPKKKWARTSDTPQCSNPSCCSREQHDNSAQIAKCSGGKHNKNCCFAEENRACSPSEWVFLYSQAELSPRDVARRLHLARWMSGKCSLNEALESFHEEWGEEEPTYMEAA